MRVDSESNTYLNWVQVNVTFKSSGGKKLWRNKEVGNGTYLALAAAVAGLKEGVYEALGLELFRELLKK